MKNFAPDIVRQRLIVEGIYNVINPSCLFIKALLVNLTELLHMHIVYGPTVIRGAEKIDPKYCGYEGHIIWAESGCSIYTWENQSFFSIDLYSCKSFEVGLVVTLIMNMMKTGKKIDWKEV